MKLMEMLVELVLLYEAEVWRCGGQLRPVENVQMRRAESFRGGETSSIGLPTVRDEHAAGEVGSNEEKYGVLGAGNYNGQWQIVGDSDD